VALALIIAGSETQSTCHSILGPGDTERDSWPSNHPAEQIEKPTDNSSQSKQEESSGGNLGQ